MSVVRVDVAVLGAGAAGAAAACALAPSASVALVDRVATPGWRIGETLPGAARRLLAALGAWPRFAAAGHAPAPLKISRWGSDEPVELDSLRDPDGHGWRLDRARFECDLRVTAMERGALPVAAAVARLERRSDGWLVTLDTGATLVAARLIGAAGRRGRLLRAHGQRRLVTDRLACVFQRVAASGADPTTYTHAVSDGWWYTAPLPGGERVVAFHGDADEPAVRRTLRDGPVAAAARVPGLAEAIGSGGRPLGEPSLCAANSAAASAAGDGWLAAGDAVLAFDPLSSQGLFNALATGLEAAGATRALLAGDVAAARSYADRIGSIWQAYRRHHAIYYGMEQRWPDAPFWRSRHLHGRGEAIRLVTPTGIEPVLQP